MLQTTFNLNYFLIFQILFFSSKMDPQSAANFEEIVIEHVKVIWDVDFDQKIFYGKAFLSAVAVKDTDKIVKFQLF